MANASDLYELQWNNHTKVLKRSFDRFRTENELVDVTLCCEGKKLKAHKIVLSACSVYFLDLFKDNPCQHPIIILRDVKYQAMFDLLSFMYAGEVNIAIEHLNTFLQTAEFLQVKGLSIELSPNVPADNVTDLCVSVETKQNGSMSDDSVTNISQKSIENADRTPDVIDLSDMNEKNDSTGNVIVKSDNETQDNLMDDAKIQERNISQERRKFPHTSFEDPGLNVEDNNDSGNIPNKILRTEYIEVEDFTDNESIEYLDENTELNQDTTPPFSIMKTAHRPAVYPESRSYPCPHCKKVFNHHISLKLHLPRHTGGTSCVLCPAVLGRKYDLKVHLRRKHNIDINDLKSYF